MKKDNSKNALNKETKKIPAKKDNSKNNSTKSSKKEKISIHVWDIRLSKDTRKNLRKVKDCLWGSVADAIECGNWYIPVYNHKFTHIKKCLESGMKKFFKLKKDMEVVVDDFMTEIIEFDNHK